MLARGRGVCDQLAGQQPRIQREGEDVMAILLVDSLEMRGLRPVRRQCNSSNQAIIYGYQREAGTH